MTRARKLQLWPRTGTRKKTEPHFLESQASMEEQAGGFGEEMSTRNGVLEIRKLILPAPQALSLSTRL